MTSDDLLAEHDRCRDDAIRMFRSKRKMGGDDYSKTFHEMLENDLEVYRIVDLID